LALTYNSGNFSVDLGYNIWGRSGERLTITESFDASRYAILGRQDVGVTVFAVEVNSTLCQPTATISSWFPVETSHAHGA
jgi:hypothetical protein